MDTTNSSEKPQRRVKHGQRPTEPLADWPTEFGAAGAEQPAATSGDALDLQQLKALALAATPGIWEAQRHGVIVAGPMREYAKGSTRSQIAAFNVTFHDDDAEDEPDRKQANAAFCAAARPEVVLDLIARIERAAAPAPAWFSYEESRDTLIIHGIKYSGEVMRDFGNLMPQGQLFELVDRQEDGALCVKRIEPATTSGDELPPVLFDGHAVYREVMANDPHTPRVNADQISDVLDAVVRLLRKDRAAVSAATKPTTEQIADVIERLIGACIMDWHSSDPDDAFNSDNEERRTLVDAVDKALAAKRAATKPTADLSNLTKYGPCYGNVGHMVERANDEYVKLSDVQSLLATKPAAAPEVAEELRKALQTVARWEVPPTGKTWDDGSPMSYAACYGSNGERDYMRQVALNALAATPAASTPAAPAELLTIERIGQLIEQHTDRDFGLIVEPFARAIAADVASRCRAQGGITNNTDSGNSAASTIGAAQTADQGGKA